MNLFIIYSFVLNSERIIAQQKNSKTMLSELCGYKHKMFMHTLCCTRSISPVEHNTSRGRYGNQSPIPMKCTSTQSVKDILPVTPTDKKGRGVRRIASPSTFSSLVLLAYQPSTFCSAVVLDCHSFLIHITL